jgi:hypothetical protein
LREMMNLRVSRLFWFSFCLLSSRRSPFNTRILCYPFRHSIFFIYLWIILSLATLTNSSVGLVPETLVSWVVGSLALSSSLSAATKRIRRDDDFWWRCVYT